MIDIFDKGMIIILEIFLFIHAVYFLGAAIFKQNAFIKMTISITIISFLIALVFGLTVFFMNKATGIDISGNHMEPLVMKRFLAMGKYCLIVLTPILWIIAYMRLKETEL